MAIKKVKITNFRSFKEAEVHLGAFNVLIGANASGKSNFVQLFRFLRDIRKEGLDNAISLQSGVEYLRNINIGNSQKLSIEITSDPIYFSHPAISRGLLKYIPRPAMRRGRLKQIGRVKIGEIIYKFSIDFKKARGRGPKFKIVEDEVILKIKDDEGPLLINEKLFSGDIVISKNQEGKISVIPRHDRGEKGEEEIRNEFFSLFFWDKQLLPPENLLLEISDPFLRNILDSITVYDFDPKQSKKAIPISGKAELEEDGANLSIVLKNIMEDKEERRKLLNLVRDLLPFVRNFSVEKFADRSLIFELHEVYSDKHHLPASLISDGTINVLALVIALYFEGKSLAIIEEPERNMHPHLVSKIVEMMKDAAQKKQIIVTTHNPEMVKYAGMENILLVSRDKDGFSTICRPSEKKEIQTFLKNEMEIEELFVQNLLELNA